jgi:chemotaxis regulatin CheY-phosphate phosphatase CheZ
MRSRRRVTSSLGVAVVAALVLAAGCGDDTPTADEATADVCDARDRVDEAITQTERLDPTDLDGLADVREQIEDDVDELEDAGQELSESAWDDVESAAQDVEDAIDEIDADSEFREANEQLSAARERLAEAWDSFVSDVDCGS